MAKLLLGILVALVVFAPGVVSVANATVNEVVARNDYSGNGSTTAFTYTFKILTKNDIQVYVGTTLKVVDTDYSVSGLGASGGGSVTLFTPPASGVRVALLRKQPVSQLSVYQPNEPFPAKRIETDLDKQAMIDQQQIEYLNRTVHVPKYTFPFTTELDPAGQANKFIRIKPDGTGFMLSDALGVPNPGPAGLSDQEFLVNTIDAAVTPNARALSVGFGLSKTDGGAGGSLTIALNSNIFLDITDPAFGASTAGSGATNRGAIQAAHDSSRCPSTGCNIFIPSGGFTLDTTPILVTKPVTFIGTGLETSILNTPATTTTVFNVTTVGAVNFYNMAIVYTGTATTSKAIHINPAAAENFGGSRFKNLKIKKAAVGIQFEAGSEWCIETSRFDDMQVSGVIIKNPNSPDYGENCINFSIFTATGTTPDNHIEFHSGGGLRIIGNKFLQGDIQVALTPAVNTSVLQMVGNSFENYLTHGVQWQDSAGTFAYASIAGNEFGLQDGSRSGITIGTSGIQISITGNTFHFFSSAAGPRSGVLGTNGATDVYVGGNVFQDENGGGESRGVEITGTAAIAVGPNKFGSFISFPVVGTPTTTDTSSLTFRNNQDAIRLLPYSTSAGNTSEIRFFELVANGINYAGFKAADSIATSFAFTLPNALPAGTRCVEVTVAGVWQYAAAACGTGGGGTVDSVTGTADRITISGTAADPIVDIAATYVGQTSITTLGTVTTGTWNVPAGSVTANTGVFKTSTTLGTASSVAGAVVFHNATNANTFTITSGVSASNVAILLPVDLGADGTCLSHVSAGQMGWANCSSGGTGLTSLGGQTGATQTFAAVDDANIDLTIGSSGNIHTFTVAWVGQLSAARGGFGADMSAATGGISFNAGARVVSNVLGSPGRLVYADTGNAFGTNASLAWDNVNKVLNLNANAVAIPNGPLGTLMRVAGLDNTGVYMTIDSYGTGNATSGYQGRRSRGTAGALAAVQLDDALVVLTGFGYGTSEYSATARGSFAIHAGQTWTNTAQCAFAVIDTTPIGSTTLTERVRVMPDGKVGIATTDPKAPLHVFSSAGVDSFINIGPGALGAVDGLNIGYGGATFGAGRSFINAHAAVAANAEFRFLINGSTVMTLDNTLGVKIGAPAGGVIAGSMNVTGGYYVNGVLVGGLSTTASVPQVPFMTSATNLGGDAAFTWDNSGKTLVQTRTATGAASQQMNITFDGSDRHTFYHQELLDVNGKIIGAYVPGIYINTVDGGIGAAAGTLPVNFEGVVPIPLYSRLTLSPGFRTGQEGGPFAGSAGGTAIAGFTRVEVGGAAVHSEFAAASFQLDLRNTIANTELYAWAVQIFGGRDSTTTGNSYFAGMEIAIGNSQSGNNRGAGLTIRNDTGDLPGELTVLLDDALVLIPKTDTARESWTNALRVGIQGTHTAAATDYRFKVVNDGRVWINPASGAGDLLTLQVGGVTKAYVEADGDIVGARYLLSADYFLGYGATGTSLALNFAGSSPGSDTAFGWDTSASSFGWRAAGTTIMALDNGASSGLSLIKTAGAGNKVLCVDNNGRVFRGASDTAC